MKDLNYNLTVTGSFLTNLPNTINLMNFKKNTKVTKFVLLNELIYIIIYQFRNYNKLYSNLLAQITLVKKKIFQKIKNEILLKNNINLFNKFKSKLKEKNINAETFLKKIIFHKKNIFLLKRFIKKNKHDSIEFKNVYFEIFSSLQKALKKNNENILLKYSYIKKIELYIKKNTVNVFKKLKTFFFPIIFNILKKEAHQLKLKSFLRKIINHYAFKNLNLNLSKEKLQSTLLKYFKISTKYNIRLLPYIEELHLKERKQIRKKKDITTNLKLITDEITSKFNISYLRLLKMLNKNNLSNLSFSRIIDLLKILEKKNSHPHPVFDNLITMYNKQSSNFFISDLYNNKINIFENYKLNVIYILNNDCYSLFKKDFLNNYYMYNLFNSLSKRKYHNFFLSVYHKQLEYFTFSPLKYYYYDIFSMLSKKNEIDSSFLLTYSKISNLFRYLKRYKHLFSSLKKIKLFFKIIKKKFFKRRNFFYSFVKGFRKRRKNFSVNFNIKVKLISLFFENLINIYNNKLYKDTKNTKRINFLKFDLFNFKEIMEYISTYKRNRISSRFLNKQRLKISKKLKYLLNNYLTSYFTTNNISTYNNLNYNNLNYKDINNVNKLFNFSEMTNKNYIYSKYNSIYKKYFNYIREQVIKQKYNKEILILKEFSRKLNLNKEVNISTIKLFHKSILNYKPITINLNIEKKKINYNKEDTYNNLLITKLLKLELKEVKLENLKDYLISNLFSFNFLVFNKSLKYYLLNIYNKKDNKYFVLNKEIIKKSFDTPLIVKSFKEKINNIYNGNIILINTHSSYNVKEIMLNENINNHYYKKLLFYKNIINLSKKNTNIISKNNILFISKTFENKYINDNDILKMNESFSIDDFNRVLSKNIGQTTTELRKMTKYQMKRKKLKRIY